MKNNQKLNFDNEILQWLLKNHWRSAKVMARPIEANVTRYTFLKSMPNE